MNPERRVMLEIFGEGKTDIGEGAGPDSPSTGVVPILVHALCGKPNGMLVKRRAFAFLQGKKLPQKVHFAKRQACYNGSAGAVFVVDSEGDTRELTKKKFDLEHGRDQALPEFPMAVGVAHPCIEAWLLADASAIRRACRLPRDPEMPHEPEQLPAPNRDRNACPKAVLGQVAGAKGPLESEEMWRIASEVRQLDLLRTRCPLGFAPFAEEVEHRIRPLF